VITKLQAAMGDVAGAEMAFGSETDEARRIESAPGKSFALSAVADECAQAAEIEARAGDMPAAQKLFAAAVTTAGLIEDTILADRSHTFSFIAKHQIEGGGHFGSRPNGQPDHRSGAAAIHPGPDGRSRRSRHGFKGNGFDEDTAGSG
jgi:hypothetical protein